MLRNDTKYQVSFTWKWVFRVLVYLLVIPHANAATRNSPYFIIDSIYTHPVSVGHSLYWIDDPQHRYDSATILSGQASYLFNRGRLNRPEWEDQTSALWIRVMLINATDNAMPIHLVLSWNADSIFFYRREKGIFTRQISGNAIPASQRSVSYLFGSMFTVIAARETCEVYIRCTKDNYFPTSNPQVRLYTGLSLYFYEYERKQTWWINGLFTGISLLMAVYALALLIIFREKAYVWLIFSQLANIGYCIDLNGIGALYLFPDWVLLNKYGYGLLFSKLVLLFHFLFVANYLRLRFYFPVMWRLLSLAVLLYCINGNSLSMWLGGHATLGLIQNILLLIIILVLFALVVYLAFIKKIRTARIMAWADLSLLLMVILSVFPVGRYLHMERGFLTLLFQSGFTIQMFIWTIAIVDKITGLRKAKEAAAASELEIARKHEKLIAEQNIVLEQKVKERTQSLQLEKQKTNELLHNILPEEIVVELKSTGKTKARQYDPVTVLFTDFVNFTGISEKMSPDELVSEIHENFTAFDAIMEKHGLEKIKTIGDAYMAVCGLPVPRTDHAQRALYAALDIQQYVMEKKGKFNIRIGLHSGPVVAGIVGVKKYAYDIWGDTVNLAARMEQHSEAGKINISRFTYELVKNEFSFEHRGKVKAKHKGEIDMYFVTGISA